MVETAEKPGVSEVLPARCIHTGRVRGVPPVASRCYLLHFVTGFRDSSTVLLDPGRAVPGYISATSCVTSLESLKFPRNLSKFFTCLLNF